eukprot:gene1361-1895_t
MAERLFLNVPPYIRRHSGSGNWVYPEATAFAMAHGLVEEPVVPQMNVQPDLVDSLAMQLAALPRPRFVFAIGSSDLRRNWGAERFAALAGALTEADLAAVAQRSIDAEALLRTTLRPASDAAFGTPPVSGNYNANNDPKLQYPNPLTGNNAFN